MVKVDTLYQIDVRLREIKGISKPFGGVSLVLLGDPLQLRPVTLCGKQQQKGPPKKIFEFWRYSPLK